MTFSRKPDEPIQEVETEVWACQNSDCIGWMRDAYSFEEKPTCPLCHSEMKKEIRMLPEIK